MKLAAALWLAVFANLAQSAGLPPQVNLRYEISSAAGVIGVAEQTVARNGDDYAITNEVSAKGLLALFNKGDIEQSSRGNITKDGLRPARYSDRRGSKAPAVATFDWNAGVLKLERGGATSELPLEKNTLDRLSFPFSFAFSRAPQEKLSVAMTDGKRIKTYEYVVAGKERLKTRLGELETLHLVKQLANSEDARAELWLSLEHHLLPVRLLIAEEGKPTLDQLITNINY